MRNAVIVKWCVALVFLSFVLLAQATASADETSDPCSRDAKSAFRWSDKECERLRSRPADARTVVYRDAARTVLVARSSIVRTASALDATLIFDNHGAAGSQQGARGPRSQVRRQRIDCSTRQQAVLEWTNYDEPVGRGLPGAAKRDPSAPMEKIASGSVDARVADVLCAPAREG